MLTESAQQVENTLNERFVRESGIANMREHARLKLECPERYVGAAFPGVAANRDMTGARFAARRTAYSTMQGLGPRAGVFHSREDRRGWRRALSGASGYDGSHPLPMLTQNNPVDI